MGSKNQPTIGYWYRPVFHFGFSRGPLDALLEIRGGDKVAWEGEQTSSGTIYIDALNLWGGEKAEGGIQGYFELLMGEAEQAQSAYLLEQFGEEQSAFRGRATGIFKGGKYGAFNPYSKPMSFKVRGIVQGWDCWYPEKAEITYAAGEATSGSVSHSDIWQYQMDATNDGESLGYHTTAYDHSGWASGPGIFNSPGYGTPGTVVTPYTHTGSVWLRRTISGAGITSLELTAGADDRLTVWWNGVQVYDASSPNVVAVLTFDGADIEPENTLVVRATDLYLSAISVGASYTWEGTAGAGLAMNPAHMLYRSIVEFQGEPEEAIDEASFTAGADTLYDEGFGLCTTFDPVSETCDQFRQRIGAIIGGTVSQSRVDGKYHLVLIRDDYVLEDLPILEDDDILKYEEEASDPLEAVNQVSVEWFDLERKEKRTTAPLQSLGAIQACGGIIAETGHYPEIPTEELALRVGQRDLDEKSASLRRFRLTTNRRPYAWLRGQLFRLQAPRRGIADMVCRLGQIDAGTPRSGSMNLVATQHVGGLQSTSYVTPEPGVDTSTPETPTAAAAETAIEAPYLDLAGSLSNAELAALPEEAGYLMVVAKRGSAGLNYTLMTAADGEALVDRGTGDWCPSALVVEAADPGDTSFTLSGATLLELVELGTAALWDDEIVRVDALDATAGTITIARGCGDTVPAPSHSAGARIWFYDAWAASDRREYLDGELVHARVLPRTASQQLPAGDAADLTVTMDQRAARPYPPGKLRVNTAAYPAGPFGGEISLTWTHRDRLLQADQVVDTEAASVGPEAGTTYTVRWYVDDVLVETQSGITGTGTTYEPASGEVRVEVEAVRDGLASWQYLTHTFTVTTYRATEAGDRRITESGDYRITE